jgi:hypothetical protein
VVFRDDNGFICHILAGSLGHDSNNLGDAIKSLILFLTYNFQSRAFLGKCYVSYFLVGCPEKELGFPGGLAPFITSSEADTIFLFPPMTQVPLTLPGSTLMKSEILLVILMVKPDGVT